MQQVCHDGSTHHLFRRHGFAQGRSSTESDRSISSGQGHCAASPCKVGLDIIPCCSRAGAVFEVLPNQSDHPSPLENWAPKKPRTIYHYNCIKNQEMLWPSSPNRWLYPCANNLSYLTFFHYKLNIVLNCCALLGNKNSPRNSLLVSPLNRIDRFITCILSGCSSRIRGLSSSIYFHLLLVPSPGHKVWPPQW